MRLFVAVELAAELKQGLSALADKFMAARADVKWVEGENFHLTLYFLGEVPPDLLPRVQGALSEAGAGVPPFTLKLEGVGAFPSLARPRVIWVGARGGEELLRLQQQVAAGLTPLLAGAQDSRPFSPHITLGRVRSPRNLSALSRLLQEHGRESVGEQRVTGFSLVESQLFRSGPVYTRVAHYSLGN